MIRHSIATLCISLMIHQTLIAQEDSTSESSETNQSTEVNTTDPEAFSDTPTPEEIDPFYLEVLTQGAQTVIERHKLFKASSKYAEAIANDIRLLKFENKEDMYSSQDESSTHSWLYLGATHKVIHSNGKRIICMTNTPLAGDYYLAFAEDGSVMKVSFEQYQKIREHGIKTHK